MKIFSRLGCFIAGHHWWVIRRTDLGDNDFNCDLKCRKCGAKDLAIEDPAFTRTVKHIGRIDYMTDGSVRIT